MLDNLIIYSNLHVSVLGPEVDEHLGMKCIEYSIVSYTK
jgi:hypothetical protein